MKKLICLVLALVLCLTTASVMAFAETATPGIVVDGVMDEAYNDDMSITSDYWYFYQDNAVYEPVDTERVLNTLYFNWDDEYVYCYFTATSKDDLYRPAEGVTKDMADEQGDWYETVSIWMDMAPSGSRDSGTCQSKPSENCQHLYCNCNAGEYKYNRLQTRFAPAWDKWWNYFRSDEGMFQTFEKFVEGRQGEEGYEDLEAMYALENGDCEAVSFIDYSTNTYGCEWKYKRVEGEEHFLVNVVNGANAYEWEVEGPELEYTISANGGWWMNFDGMFDIYFSDYVTDEDPEVVAVQRLIASIPDEITDENYAEAKTAYQNAEYKYSMLDETQAAQITDEEVEKMINAGAILEVFEYLNKVGDVDGSEVVDAGDALVALKVAVGKLEIGDEEMALADVTGDGKVDAGDALDMLKFAVGKLDEFAVVTAMKAELGM